LNAGTIQMKQHRDGQRIINWHKPIQPGVLKRRYVRNRYEDLNNVTDSWAQYEDDSEDCFLDDCFDDYWDYFHTGDEFDHLFTEAMWLTRQSWPPRPPLLPPLPPSLSADLVSPASTLSLSGRFGDAQQSGDLASRLAAFVSIVKQDREAGIWPPPAFAAMFTDACRAGRGQLEVLWQHVSNVIPEAETTAGMAFAFAPFWIRNPQEWSPAQACPAAQLIVSFIDHLFVRYSIPRFLYSNWTLGFGVAHVKWLCWFILLGQGGSLHRAAKLMGWDVPKNLTRFLEEVPENLRPLEGCMYAEVIRLGAGEAEFRRLASNPAFAIDPTSGKPGSTHTAFWRETVKWLARYQDELSDGAAGTILNWSMHEFTESERAGRAFSWRGRTPVSSLAAAEAYLRSLEAPYIHYQWKSHGWDWASQDEEDWSVQELVSGPELCDESRAMHHCVASYAARCYSDYSAIFSVRKHGARVLTVEVTPGSGQIVQVRGTCNRSPTAAERALVDRWWREAVRGR
jgi:hypothetical protein